MRVLAVRVGRPRDLSGGGGRVAQSGIVKAPVDGPVRMTRDGLEGDQRADLKVHGGRKRAVYAYPVAHYRRWAAEGVDAAASGAFGENLTVEGADERTVHLGDRFRVGRTVVEVTHPRIPCWKLGARVGDAAFPRRFLKSRRTGFFFRVVEEGPVAAGDTLVATVRGPGAYTVRETLELLYGAVPDRDRLRGLAGIEALPKSWRRRASEVAAGG